jgi:uncharacterized phage-associated protein
MTATPNDLAMELLDRLDLDQVANAASDKLHKLLYYAQGHHAAVTGQPLFTEAIEAAETGPVVAGFAGLDVNEVRGELDNAQRVSLAYVVSRYGRLSILDLQHLTRSEPPYRQARRAGRSAIDLQDMVAYFKGDGAPFDAFEALPRDQAAMDAHLAAVGEQIRKRKAQTGG